MQNHGGFGRAKIGHKALVVFPLGGYLLIVGYIDYLTSKGDNYELTFFSFNCLSKKVCMYTFTYMHIHTFIHVCVYDV